MKREREIHWMRDKNLVTNLSSRQKRFFSREKDGKKTFFSPPMQVIITKEDQDFV